MTLQNNTIGQETSVENKKRTIIDVLETQADLFSTKALVTIKIILCVLSLISSFYLVDLFEALDYLKPYKFFYFLGLTSSILFTGCFVLIFLNAKKRVFNFKLIKLLKILYIINGITSIFLTIFNYQNAFNKFISIVIGIIVLGCMLHCINCIISGYTENKFYEMSNGFRIFIIVSGAIGCLGSLFILQYAFLDKLFLLLFITYLLSAIINFYLASFIKQYNITVGIYSAHNSSYQCSSLNSDNNFWRCPVCNTKNSINSKTCKSCYKNRDE